MGRIRDASTAGARGPMQFLPSSWAQYGAGGDIEDLTDASKAAARLLQRNGVGRDPRAAVWSYNHSAAYVDAVLAYAAVMAADPRAFYGYHGWQVFYRHAQGDTLLPEGWTG
jgi:membrane-bound lytic murein transglycosylase B